MLENSSPNDKKKNALFDMARRLVNLYVENARLTAAEKLTVFLSTLTIVILVIVLAFLALLFIAIGITNMLDEYIPPYLSYFIIAGLFLLMIGAIFAFKTQLILNPFARFISRLIVNPPKTK